MIELLEKDLCSAFCSGMEVYPVPSGFAVSAPFTDGSGDKITFYITQTPDGFQAEDDGDYLASLIASGVQIDVGGRAQMLDAILEEGGAHWDRETFEIKTNAFPAADIGARSIDFLSSLIRVRDLALVTRERVRSAFRDDFLSAIAGRFGDTVTIHEHTVPANDLSEFPADILIEPISAEGKKGAIYLVNTNDKLNEALLAWRELQDHPQSDVSLMAVLEDSNMSQISRRKWQRAQNRRLPMPVFRGDEAGMLDFISAELKLSA